MEQITEEEKKIPLYTKALKELNLTSSGFSYRKEDAETLCGFEKKGFTFHTLSDSQVAEVETKYLELQAEYDAQEYARNRATAFPSIGDQLDMQYHDQLDGTTTWKDAIAKVKSDHPKG